MKARKLAEIDAEAHEEALTGGEAMVKKVRFTEPE